MNMTVTVNDFISINGKGVDNVFPKLLDAQQAIMSHQLRISMSVRVCVCVCRIKCVSEGLCC